VNDRHVFECEIPARLRDINLAGHVDNVEAMRVLDEARQMFLRFSVLPDSDALAAPRPGLFREVPEGVVELVASQRVEYHAEMRFVPFQPFLVRMWIGHVSRSSFTICFELRVSADGEPAIVAETTNVMWDSAESSAWRLTDTVRRTLEHYRGEPVALRPRAGE
jgi:acyl-CoA thioester hydrolase